MKTFEIAKKLFGKFKVIESIHAPTALKAVQKFKGSTTAKNLKKGKYYLLRNGKPVEEFRLP